MTEREDLQFADLVVAQGLCSREKVDECLAFIARLAEAGVAPLPKLGEVLLRKGFLTPDQLHASMTLRAGAPTGTRRRELALPPEAAEAEKNPMNLFGNYVKVSRLGAGGMGEVWKGWDRALARWVALKFLHQDDPRQVERFRREAQTAAALSHPNVAGVYEVGEANGKPYIAMQFVEGQTLQTFPRRDVRALAGLVRDAALGLQHAHEKGVIHRDLKPANLMVEGARVFVMDFGLAKATSVDSSLSVSGSVLGTPAYMPPEQARGQTERVSPASDVYSLGATLYELLTDRAPFHAADVYALLARVVDQDPLPPRRIRPSIDRDLETIVLKCLEKDPGRRYGSAKELADELDRWLKGEAILSHPPSAAYRIRKFLGRRKGLVAIGVAGAAAVAATVAFLLPRWLHERTLQELGPLRTQIAVVREWTRQPFRKPEEVHRALEAEIDGVSAFVALHPDLPQGRYVRAQARLALGDLAGAEADARGALRLDAGFLPAWTLLGKVKLEEYAGLVSADSIDPLKLRTGLARPVLEEAREALRRGRTEVRSWGLARTRDDDVGETIARAMTTHYVDGKTEEAMALLRDAHARSPSEEYCLWSARWLPYAEERARWIKAAMDVAPLYAPAHLERGNFLASLGQRAEAARAYTDAIARDPRSSAARIARGLARGHLLEFEGSIADFTEALRLDPRDASALVYRSAVLSQKGDLDGAIADCTRALEIRPDSNAPLINRAIARRNKRDYPGALADLDAALRINPRDAVAWTNRAGLRQEMGEVKGGIEDVSKAIEIDGTLWKALHLRGVLRRQTVDLPGSEEDLSKAVDLLHPTVDPSSRAEMLGERSQTRLARGELAGGMKDAEEAVRLDGKRAKTHAWLADAFIRSNDLAGALRGFAKAVELEGKNPDYRYALGAVRLAAGELPAAEEEFGRVLGLDPRHARALLGRAAARQRRGDHAGAVEDCTKAVAAEPRFAEAWLTRAWSLAALRKFDEAAADAERGISLLPAASPQMGLARSWLEAFRAGRSP